MFHNFILQVFSSSLSTVDLKIFVIKFSSFKFSHKNVFVVQDTHKKFLTVLIDSMFPDLVIWNETAHAKKKRGVRTACVLRSWLPFSSWRITSV